MAEEGCISFSAVMGFAEWVSLDVPAITISTAVEGGKGEPYCLIQNILKFVLLLKFFKSVIKFYLMF